MVNAFEDGSEPTVHLYSAMNNQVPLNREGGVRDDCRMVSEFEKLNRIGQGTYGVVYRAREIQTNKIYALKRMMSRNREDGFPISCIREINTLKTMQHPNIVNLVDIVVSKSLDNVFLVMEYCEQELANIIDNKIHFIESQIKCIMIQLLSGLDYLHKNYVVHRDLKPSNLLFTDKGVLKIADFGLARCFNMPSKSMSPQVVTLWYRAPEILFQMKCQTDDPPPSAIDMWAAGCIFGELLLEKPLLPGKTEIEQIDLVINLLGTPNDQIWPGFSSLPICQSYDFKHQPYNNISHIFSSLSASGIRLMNSLLMYDPKRRSSAADCLNSSYLRDPPLPCNPDSMPFFPRFPNEA